MKKTQRHFASVFTKNTWVHFDYMKAISQIPVLACGSTLASDCYQMPK